MEGVGGGVRVDVKSIFNFIGIKSSHRTVTSHMYTITQLHVQLQSQIDPYTNVFLYIYI